MQSTLLESLQQLNFSHLLYFWSVARHGSIVNACQRLNVSQPTISMQIRKLEQSLGHRLFECAGRNLELTDVGRTVFEYADEMFSIGRELLGTLRGLPGKRTGRLHVGIPYSLPRFIATQVLAPILRMPQPVQLICHQGEPSELLTGLVRHRFDLILSDSAIHSSETTRLYHHPVSESEIVFCGTPALSQAIRNGFPESLGKAPLLLPSTTSDLRRKVDRWFDSQTFSATNVVAEFDDLTLMQEFGKANAGIFPVTSAVASEIRRTDGFEQVGTLPDQSVSYFAITTDRKLTHPATKMILQNANGIGAIP